jgi:hypothetical protein
MLPNLVLPQDFQRNHRDLFRTYTSLRYHLDRRHQNGLLQSGAVVETRLGLRIVPDKFPDWLLKQPICV